jgi:hypothetical protein
MNARRLCAETQRGHIYSCRRFAGFLKRSPDTATAEDIRRFQLHLSETGVIVRDRDEYSASPISASGRGCRCPPSGRSHCMGTSLCPSVTEGSVANAYVGHRTPLSRILFVGYFVQKFAVAKLRHAPMLVGSGIGQTGRHHSIAQPLCCRFATLLYFRRAGTEFSFTSHIRATLASSLLRCRALGARLSETEAFDANYRPRR